MKHSHRIARPALVPVSALIGALRKAAGRTAPALLAALAVLAPATTPARAQIVLLRTSSGAAGAQDANLYDWSGQWISALDRAAPLAGQRPPWQIDVGLYGDWYQPSGSSILEEDPVCAIRLQISGAPAVSTVLSPCVQGPNATSLDGAPESPTPESLTPNLAAATDGPHTVTVTAYDSLAGKTSSASFDIDVDNTLPSPAQLAGPASWQRGAGIVTSIADGTGPSGIAGQYCSIGSSPPSWYPGPSAQLAVTGDGAIPVRCSAQNNAGVSGPPAELDALLDNTPPGGYFQPADPSEPTRATVAVSDSQSGVGGGEIELQNSGRWQALPTSYSAASGRMVATIPDTASVPDGQHAVRAVVWDLAGNRATITNGVDGAPESVLLPLRIVTRIRIDRATVLAKRCTRKRAPGRRAARDNSPLPVTRFAARCTTVSLPRSPEALELRYGQAARVAGVVLTADGEPVAHAPITVAEQPSGWPQLPTRMVTAGPDGRFTYRIEPGPSRTITFSFAGTYTLRSALGSTDVKAAAAATLAADRLARAHRPLRLSGRLTGGYIPAEGTLVQLQYRVVGYSRAWAPFDKLVRSAQDGHWATTITLPPGAAGFTYLLRGVVFAQSGWPFSGAVTNVVSRNVLR